MQYSLMDEFKAFKPADKESGDRVYCPDTTCNATVVMPGLHLQLNRRKSRAPPATQPSLIFKDLRRLSCTIKTWPYKP